MGVVGSHLQYYVVMIITLVQKVIPYYIYSKHVYKTFFVFFRILTSQRSFNMFYTREFVDFQEFSFHKCAIETITWLAYKA